MLTEEEKGLLGIALHLIEKRQKHEEEILAHAVENKQWSQVSGRDGIAIGLMIAAKYIREIMGEEK